MRRIVNVFGRTSTKAPIRVRRTGGAATVIGRSPLSFT